MKIDSAGMPVFDDEPAPALDLRWVCPSCGCSTWPGIDPHGHVVARMCIGCQIAYDDATHEAARARSAVTVHDSPHR